MAAFLAQDRRLVNIAAPLVSPQLTPVGGKGKLISANANGRVQRMLDESGEEEEEGDDVSV